MALNPDDLLLVNRSGTNFKIEYGLLKQNIINGIGGAIVSEDEPDGRHEGDLWYQPSTDSLFVWVVSDTTGVVTSVSVRNGGSGYTTNETNVATIGGDGEGLTLDIQAGVGGNYASPTVNQGGSGYAVSNVVFLTGAGNQNGSATVTAVNTVATGAWEAVGAGEGGGSSVSVGDTAPAGPQQGDLWYNTDDGRLYVWYVDANTSQWVDASPAGGGGGEGGGGDTIINYNGASAWGYVAADGTLLGGMNCTTSKISNGEYSVTFNNPLPNSNYSITTSIESSGDIKQIRASSQTANGFLIFTQLPDTNLVDNPFSFAVHATNALPPRGGTGADAWGVITGAGVEQATFNSSVARTDVGRYQVTFTNPMPSANYSVVGSASPVSTVSVGSRTVNGFLLSVTDGFGAFVDVADAVHYVVHATNAQLPDTVTQEQLDAVLDNWTRTGTTLSPTNDGDAVEIGDIKLNDNGVANFSILGSTADISVGSFGTSNVIPFLNVTGTDGVTSHYRSDAAHIGGDPVNNAGNIILRADGSASFTNNGSTSIFTAAPFDTSTTQHVIALIAADGTTTHYRSDGVQIGGNAAAGTGNISLKSDGTATFNNLTVFNKNSTAFGDANLVIRQNGTTRAIWQTDGTLKIGGVDVANSPNITLNQNGTISGSNVTFGLTPEQQTTYGLQELDVKEKVLNFITRVNQLEALSVNLANRLGAVESNEIIDDATDTALLQLLANASSRLDSIEARLTALEGN